MSAPITEAHRELARNIMFYHTPKGSATAQGVRDAAQLIADSEAREVALHRHIATQLAAVLNAAGAPEFANADHASQWAKEISGLAAECDQLRADLERFTGHGLLDVHAICDQRDAANARAERAEAELAAERARLDWLEKARPIAWALGSEECGEYWILTDTGEKHPEEAEEFATLRAAIDAAMKEETK